MTPGTKVIFHGGWGDSAFAMRGIIEGPYIGSDGKYLDDVHVVCLISGSVHYGYSHQFEIVGSI